MTKALLLSIGLYIVSQTLMWFQTNSQFFSNWASKNDIVLTLLGLPVSYMFIYATKYSAEYFNGLIWPGRLIAFATGMIVMSSFTFIFFSEGLNFKTGLTLVLSLAIVLIQILL